MNIYPAIKDARAHWLGVFRQSIGASDFELDPTCDGRQSLTKETADEISRQLRIVRQASRAAAIAALEILEKAPW